MSDEELLSLLDSFWVEECHCIPSKLGAASFSRYLQRVEYSISDSALRNKANVMEKIALLKTQPELNTLPPNTPPAHETAAELSHEVLLEKLREARDFISSTYVKGVCCQLAMDELNLSMECPVKTEAAKRDLITPETNPFTSPIVEKMAKLFDLEEEDEQDE